MKFKPLYTSKANEYELFNKKYGYFSKGSKSLVQLTDFSGASLVVDLCCGTGITSEEIRKVYSDKIVGIEKSENMINIAEKKFVKDKNIQFIIGNAENLPDYLERLERVDIILCNCGLQFLNLEKTFQSISCVLKGDGIFIFNLAPDFYEPLESTNTFHTIFRGKYIKQIAGGKYVGEEFEKINYQGLLSILKRNGFNLIKYKIEKLPCSFDEEKDFVKLFTSSQILYSSTQKDRDKIIKEALKWARKNEKENELYNEIINFLTVKR